MTLFELAVSCGVPSGIFGIFFWMIKQDIKKNKDEQRKRDEARIEYEKFLMQMLTASVALGEANSIALQNGKCNGETKKALKVLETVRQNQQLFMINQGLEHLF